ncbi:MAG: OprO/OprP family phosphate-selective porin [Bacteroidales bacterium]|nr:OprO/OprP family phosphate-selective porin [Bacteroidales bacterium]
MKRKLICTTIFACLCCSFAFAQQTEEKEIDWTQELTKRVNVHGYEQAGFTFKDVNGYASNTFQLYRTLLWVNCDITPRWSFRVMHDFSSKLQDVYTDFKVADGLTIRFGQFKHNYTLENPMSPTTLELIDVYAQSVVYLCGNGSDPLLGVQYGRDLGLEFSGELFNKHFFYAVAAMNGQGVNVKDGNKYKDLIVKAETRVTDGLRFVVSGQLGKGHAIDSSIYNPAIKIGDNYTRNRFSAGGEFKSKPISIRSEFLAGLDGDVESLGAYCTVKVPVCKTVDVIASLDYFDKNTDVSMEQTNYTIGLQYWYFRKCRVQLQYTRCQLGYAKDYNNLQTQIQIAF